MQWQEDLIALKIVRPVMFETTVLGAAVRKNLKLSN